MIPFIQRTDDLEYRLSSFIRGMVDTTRVAVGFYVDQSEQAMPGASFNVLRQQVAQLYDVRTIALGDEDSIPASVEVVVLIGSPDSLSEGQKAQLDGFFDRGGGALIFAAGTSIQQAGAMGRPVAWNGVLERFGVLIREDMAYDLVSNEQVSLPTQFGMRLLSPYPLWLRGISSQGSPINQGLDGMFLPWASTIDTSDAPAGSVTTLFTTSEAGGVESMFVALDPTRTFNQDSLAVRTLAVVVNPLVSDSSAETGRVILVGSAQVVGDRFMQNNPTNSAVAMNAIDWLAQDDALIAIRAKNRTPPTLAWENESLASLVRWGNVAGIPVLLVVLAVTRMVRRRRRASLTYAPAVVEGGAA